MRFLYILFISLLFTTASVAQLRGIVTIRGAVADSVTGKVVYDATVSLLSARDSSLVTFTITNGREPLLFATYPKVSTGYWSRTCLTGTFPGRSR